MTIDDRLRKEVQALHNSLERVEVASRLQQLRRSSMPLDPPRLDLDIAQRQLLLMHFQALAHPVRLGIVHLLAEVGEVSVGDLAKYLRMSKPRVRWHLTTLRHGGTVSVRSEGRRLYCSLDVATIRTRQLIFEKLMVEAKGVPPQSRDLPRDEERILLPAHFQALAHPTRLNILCLLAKVGEVSVGDLAQYLRMSKPRVKRHLTRLHRGRAVSGRRHGRQVYCSMDVDTIRKQQLAFAELLTEGSSVINAGAVAAFGDDAAASADLAGFLRRSWQGLRKRPER